MSPPVFTAQPCACARTKLTGYTNWRGEGQFIHTSARCGRFSELRVNVDSVGEPPNLYIAWPKESEH